MVTEQDIKHVPISSEEIEYLKAFIADACIGGKSEIHNTEERIGKLTIDQTTGIIGEYVLSKLYFNSPLPFEEHRAWCKIHGRYGDGGADILGTNIDVKTSLVRSTKPMLLYNLGVFPDERHEGNVYVSMLVTGINDDCVITDKEQGVVAHVIGWCFEHELPNETSIPRGFTALAFVLQNNTLRPGLPEITWKDEAYKEKYVKCL